MNLTRKRYGAPGIAGSGNATGFTLIELLYVVVIMAILLTIAAPSFQDFFDRVRFRTAEKGLVNAINYARSEAIKRNDSLSISASGTETGKEWDTGWTVQDPDDTVLREITASSVAFVEKDGKKTIQFRSDGRTNGATFTLTSPNAFLKERCVFVGLNGTARVEDSDGDCDV